MSATTSALLRLYPRAWRRLLKLRIGANALSEGLIYAAFPASLMLSMECTYLKRYSRAARLAISMGGAGLIILMMWASVAIGNRI